MLLSTFWEVIGALMFVLFVCIPILLLWGLALVDLFFRRDIRWQKVLWILGILVLPIIGPLIYLGIRGFNVADSIAAAQGDDFRDEPLGSPS